MKLLNNGKSLFIAGAIFIIVLLILVIVLVRIGGAYRSGLEKFSSNDQISDVTHTERQKIRKITINNITNAGCMEVTPDGIIRVFTICENELSDARRVTDTKYILQLYKKISETDLTTLSDSAGVKCSGYSIIIETDSEKKSVCLNASENNSQNENTGGNGNGNQGGSIDEIIKIIDQVIDNIPPTPTPTPDSIAPTTIPETSITTTPTGILIPSWGSSPTPTIAAERPFICDFTDAQGKKRPYTISNIICSTEPSPGPSPIP